MLRIKDISAQTPVHITLKAKTPVIFDGKNWVIKTFKAGPKQKQNVITNFIGTVTQNDTNNKTIYVMVSSGLSLDKFWTKSGKVNFTGVAVLPWNYIGKMYRMTYQPIEIKVSSVEGGKVSRSFIRKELVRIP